MSEPIAAPSAVETEVVIVGAGPIGLEIAVALRALGVPYVHLEAGQIGETITRYPKQVRFFSSPERIAIAGVALQTVNQEKASREEYLAYLRAVVQQFGLPIRTHENVLAVEPTGGGFIVRSTRSGEPRTCSARHVILAIGGMHEPRLLSIPGEDLPHVSHFFDEPHRYFRERLLVVGGRNSAAETAVRCARAGARVALSYRGEKLDPAHVKYWILPELEGLIRRRVVEFHPNTVPVAIRADSVTLASTAGAAPIEAGADFVLLLTGYVMDTSLLVNAGAALDGETGRPKLDSATLMTTVPGLYVAGVAVAGTQRGYRLFIENCHPHVTKIVKSITGKEPPPGLVNDAVTRFDLPES